MIPIAKIVENLEAVESSSVQNGLSQSILSTRQENVPELNAWLRLTIVIFILFVLYLIFVFVIAPDIFKFNWNIVIAFLFYELLFGFIGFRLHYRRFASEQRKTINENDEDIDTALDNLQEEIDSFNEAVDNFNVRIKDFASKPDYNLEEMYECCQGFLEFRREYLIITISIFLRKDYKEVLARLEAYQDFVDYFQDMF